MDIIVRDHNTGDEGYIYSTWTKYAWYSSKNKPSLSKGKFFKLKCDEIKECLLHGKVKVACLKDDRSVIIGYIAFYKGQLLWLCIKKGFWHQGVEELLKRSIAYEEEKNEEQRG